MARPNDVLIATLIDVIADGAAVIDKKKLLWMMGKAQDRPTVWAALLEHWEDLGMDEDDLLGGEVNGKIILVRSAVDKLAKVSSWT